MLELIDLAIHTPQGCLLQPVSRTVEAGQVLAVLGPSGVGKSSLLQALAGALPLGWRMSGQVRLHGQRMNGLPLHQRRMGWLFQAPHLFEHLSVGQNLLLGMPTDTAATRRNRACDMLAHMGLAGYFERDPSSLSGGQKARVALARTLLSQPQALLLDEPFSALDDDTRVALAALVWNAVATHRLPTLLVTHHAHDIPAHAQVLRLQVGGGHA